MAFFRYQYTGPNGQVLEGTVQARDSHDAELSLLNRGILGARLIADPGRVDFHPIRTKKGSDKQRFFYFSQIAQQLKAGINPARCFEQLARLTTYPHYKESFQALADAATNGRPLSGVLALYPDLYPDHVVGTVHAGEQGGFLPEAFALLSAQAQAAHSFKRFHWFVGPVVTSILVSMPLVFAVRFALITSAQKLEGDPLLFVKELTRHIIWPFGPMTIALAAIFLTLRAILGTYEASRIRHKWGLRMPIYGPRARNECIATFTWALSRLAKSGIAPQTSWQLATEAVPNLDMADRLRTAGKMMHDGTKLSDVIFASKLFPQEYAPIISTGELVGDIETSLNQLEQVSREEFEVATTKARHKAWRMGTLVMMISGAILLIVVVKTWYQDFYSGILDHFSD
jgi:type II secretory pathway component PulF